MATKKDTFILAVETSFDDTSAAVLRNDEVLVNITSTELEVHQEWGGVVPNIAKEQHLQQIDTVIETALRRSGVGEFAALDALAVTYGPGLAPALTIGVNKIKELALQHGLPVIAGNHMEGHALSALLRNSRGKTYSGLQKPEFPALAITVSGGHTELVWIDEIGSYRILGQTLDDAAGEALDKIGRMLGLGYPAGPVIARLAEDGNPQAYELPRPMVNKDNYDFSFSGLKTAALYNTNDLKKQLSEAGFSKIVPDYAASVQEAVVDCIALKTLRAVKKEHPKMVLLGGGVAANNRLRARLRSDMRKLETPIYFPPKKFCTDNAAMIALTAYYKYFRGEFVEDIELLDRDPSITIETKYTPK